MYNKQIYRLHWAHFYKLRCKRDPVQFRITHAVYSKMIFGTESVDISIPLGGSSDPVVSGVDVGVGVSGTSTTVSAVLSDRSTVVLSATATLVGFFRLALAVFRPWSTENKGTSSSLSSSSSLHSISASEEDFFVALASFLSSSSIWPLFRRVRFALVAPSLGCDRFDGRGTHSDWEPITCKITHEACYNSCLAHLAEYLASFAVVRRVCVSKGPFIFQFQ